MSELAEKIRERLDAPGLGLPATAAVFCGIEPGPTHAQMRAALHAVLDVVRRTEETLDGARAEPFLDTAADTRIEKAMNIAAYRVMRSAVRSIAKELGIEDD